MRNSKQGEQRYSNQVTSRSNLVTSTRTDLSLDFLECGASPRHSACMDVLRSLVKAVKRRVRRMAASRTREAAVQLERREEEEPAVPLR